MEMSSEINEIAGALSKFQGDVRDVMKDKAAYGYNYADLSSVLETARPLMAKHGLSVVQMPGNAGADVVITTMLMHSSGQWLRGTITMPVERGKGMSGAQAVGSVITYARRYALAATLGISQSDNDAACQPHEPTVNGGQLQRMRDMLAKTETDEAAFAAWLGISDLSDMTVSVFNRGIQALTKKMQKVNQVKPEEVKQEASQDGVNTSTSRARAEEI